MPAVAPDFTSFTIVPPHPSSTSSGWEPKKR